VLADDGAASHVLIEDRMHLNQRGELAGGERRPHGSIRIELAAVELRVGRRHLGIMADGAAHRGDLLRGHETFHDLDRRQELPLNRARQRPMAHRAMAGAIGRGRAPGVNEENCYWKRESLFHQTLLNLKMDWAGDKTSSLVECYNKGR